MLRIRLSRTGKKRQPSYRVVVAEKDAKRDGRVVERIGYYNPLTNPPDFRIQEDRALHWLSVGAQPSDAVRVLLNKQGTFERLSRLNDGESLDALVAEYQGVPVTAAAEGQAAPSLAQRATEAASGVASAITSTVEAVAERVEDAVQAVIGADEEE